MLNKQQEIQGSIDLCRKLAADHAYDAEQIGKLIQQYLRQESLESPLNEQRLLDAWPQVLGPAASYTSNLYIRNQTLYVHLTSAALRQELMMGRELLVRTLNQRVGATVITNIIFR